MGEPRRLRHERERRPAAHAARARGHGLRPRCLPRPAARLQPVERHARAAAKTRGNLPWRRRRSDRGHKRHIRGQLPRGAEPAAPGRRVRDGSAELHADAGRRAQPWRHRTDVQPASGFRLGAGLGRVRARNHAQDTAALSLQSKQSNRLRLVSIGDGANRQALRVDRHVAAGGRGLSRRRNRPRADAELLGHERPRDRHERTLESVWNPGHSRRLDRRSEIRSSPTAGRNTTI